MQKMKIKISIISFLGLWTVNVLGQTSLKIVSRPNNTVRSMNYTNARAPLQEPCLLKLPIGSIIPEGWIDRMLQLQRDGLTGHLGEISAWLEKKNNAWLQDGGDHGWEEVPYWLKGYGDLAYILKDKSMMAETQSWIEAVLRHQKADGSFGPVNMQNDKRELWAQMIMLWVLQSYYEHTSDKRVIDLMTRYFKWELTIPDHLFLKSYWENARGGDNLYSVLWLYNRTGDSFLLQLAEKIHRNTANWYQTSTLPDWHNVNIAQGFREPAEYYMLTGDSSMLLATYNDQQLIRRTFGQVPGGMFGADENARMGYIDPRQGVETCGIVEQMASDEMMLRFTGDPYWAENCEDVAFNTYPAAVMPDFRALRYITSPNMVVSDAQNHAPGIQNDGPFLAMNPFSSRCCQHNHAQGWPYYSENLVYATPDNGIAIALYGACMAHVKVANNKTVVLKEMTHYPFEEKVNFTLEMKDQSQFPVYLRIPGWARNSQLFINNKLQKIKLIEGKYVMVTRQWRNGDTICLRLPMQLNVRHWQVNQNSVSVNYGPLTLSLKIGELYKKVDSRSTAISDSKWQTGADASKWPATEIYPSTPWNYALILTKSLNSSLSIIHKPWPADNYPFSTDGVPVEFKGKGKLIPSWTVDHTGLCGVLPTEKAPRSKTFDNIRLIPMGAARLRISVFPQGY